jgi:hypothetical protein
MSTALVFRFSPNTFVAELSRDYAARFFATSAEAPSSLIFDEGRFCAELVGDLRGLLRDAFAKVSVSPSPLSSGDASVVDRCAFSVIPFTEKEEVEHDQQSSAASERRQKFQRFRLVARDSRVASSLFLVLSRAQVVPLQNMRLILPNGGVMQLDLPDHNKMNMDEELWKQAELKFSVAIKDMSTPTPNSVRFNEVSTMAHLVQWASQSVQHCSVFEADGSASSLAIALMVLHRVLHPSLADLVQLAKHHNRRARLVALFYARYTLAPEEILPVFLPSMEDPTLVSTSSAGQDAVSLHDLCRLLLREDEVFEAWLPQYSPLTLEQLVPLLVAEAERLAALRSGAGVGVVAGVASDAGNSLVIRGDHAAAAIPSTTTKSAVPDAGPKGNASLPGFKSLRQFRESFAARRRQALREVFDIGDGFDELDEEQQFLRKNNNNSSSGLPDASAGGVTESSNRKRERADDDQATPAPSAPAASSSIIDTQKMALSHGSKVLLKLLGRTTPFRKDDYVYLEF